MKKPIAADVYNTIAEQYSLKSDLAPYNAYYERPAMLGLVGPVDGKDVLDVGCGHGYYAQTFLEAGAKRVVGVDASAKMIELARKRLGGKVELHVADASNLDEISEPASFDVIVCPLVLHYVEDWAPMFASFSKLLRSGGQIVFSVGHPMEDFKDSQNYFEVELLTEHWPSYDVLMPTYRRPLGAICSAVTDAGFLIDCLLEPLPVDELKDANPNLHKQLSHAPNFLCVRAQKAH